MTKRKQLECTKMIGGESGEEDGVIRFIASTGATDRDGDILKPEGWQLTNYKKNPVFLWSHNRRIPPIGKCVNVFVDPSKGLIMDVKFDLADDNPLAKLVYRQYKEGFLEAVSVGFDPFKYYPIDADDWWGGYVIEEMDLLECSSVTIPSNFEALQERGVKAGKDVSEIKMMWRTFEKQARDIVSELMLGLEEGESNELSSPAPSAPRFAPVKQSGGAPVDSDGGIDVASALDDIKSQLKGIEKTVYELTAFYSPGETDSVNQLTPGQAPNGAQIPQPKSAEPTEIKVAPGELDVDDFIEFDWDGNQVIGKVKEIQESGLVEVDGDYGASIEASADDPVAVVHVYELDSNGEKYIMTEDEAAANFSMVEKLESSRVDELIHEQDKNLDADVLEFIAYAEKLDDGVDDDVMSLALEVFGKI